MNSYKVSARGVKWNDEDEVTFIVANTPEQAITKARIMRGESFYRRLYAIAFCKGLRFEIIPELSSYGMIREICKRDGLYK